jgi:polysaccharide export outer membrane protein
MRYPHLQRLVQMFLLMCWALLAQAQVPTAEDPDYRLAAGDQIRVQVFQNPDLTVETRVSEGGAIRYPLIGTVEIVGLSLSAAENKIADALRSGGYLKQPQVNIALLQVRGNLVAVLGQVNRPGRFPLDTAGTRVTDMLAMAGGTTDTGDDSVVLSGTRDGKPFRKVINVAALFLPDGGPDGDLVLQGGDTLYVHRAPMFYIYGEAQRSGAHRIERGMTVLQGLAAGGGPTARGTESRLRLNRRKADGTVEQIEPRMTDLLQPGDVIYVRESLF